MINRFDRIFLSLLFIWVPLAFFVRAAEGFTLTKELVGLLVVIYFVFLALLENRKVFCSPLVIAGLLFALWMVGDSYFVALVKPIVLNASFNILLIAGTLVTVVFASRKGGSYEKLIHLAVGTGAFVSLYGFFQVLGMDKLSWDTKFQARAFSTLGNPDYMGGYLVVLLPLAFLLTLRTYGQIPFKQKKIQPATKSQKSWYWFRTLNLLLFIGLLLSRVQGSFAALAAAVLFFLIVFSTAWGADLFRNNTRSILITLAVLVVGAGAYVVRHGGMKAFTEKQISVQQRVENYQVAFQMLKDHSLLGIGLGQVGVQYPFYQAKPYSPVEYAQHPYTYSEHIHNDFLQFWVEGGLPGIAFFGALLLIFTREVCTFLKNPENKKENKELLIGVAGAMVALLVQSLSNFPLQVAPTAILFGLLLAAPLALKPVSLSPRLSVNSPVHNPLLAFLILAVLAYSARAAASSIAMRDTIGETNIGKSDNALYYGNRLAKLSPDNPKAWNALAKAQELSSKNDLAVDSLQKSLLLNPNYAESLAALAELKVKQGQFAEGLDFSEKTLALTPNYTSPLWTKSVCLFQLKRYEDSAKGFEAFLTFYPRDAQGYLDLGVCYIQLKRKSDAVEAWKKSLQYDPTNQQAIIYLKSQGIKFKTQDGKL